MNTNLHTVTIAERLAELIADNRLSADSLGKKIGVSGSIVARWIRENKPIKLSNILKLCKYFGCSVDFICGRTDNKGMYSDALITLSKKLPLLIEKSNETKDAFFKRIGLSRHIVYDWSKGSEPLSSSLIIIADALDCTLDYLLGLEN